MPAITEAAYIWKNGELIPWGEATTHVLTHSLHYGTAVFEGIRCYRQADGSSAVFRLRDHMERLVRSCKMALIPLEYTAEQLCEATLELIRANGLAECYIRPLVYRGYGQMGLDPQGCPTEVIIAAWEWGSYLGEGAHQKGVAAGISSWRQRSVNALPPAMKTSAAYMNSLLAKMEAQAHGYAEAIMLNEAGYVCEGTAENLFVIRDGILSTPPTSDGALEGITRDTVLCIADELDITMIEESLTRADLYIADEAFFTGSAAELVPIGSIDERPIEAPGPLTVALQERFTEVVTGRHEDHHGWLTSL